MKLGSLDISALNLGTTSIKEVWRGDVKIWPNRDMTYYMAGKTRSNSATWAFDRFRLYNPDQYTTVMVKDHNGNVIGEQPFSTDLSFEHTFTFDLSGNVNNDEWEIFIKGVPPNARYEQIYAYPTGYSATRNKDADISYWNLNVVNPVGGSTTDAYLRLNNQPLTFIEGALEVNSKFIYVNGTQLPPDNIDELIIGADLSGITGGTFDYTGLAPTSASKSSWDSLKAKSWNMIGAVPADQVAPASPTISLVSKTTNSISISWSAISGADDIDVYRRPAGSTSAFTFIERIVGTATAYRYSALTPDTNYELAIIARNEAGSGTSNYLTVRTNQEVPSAVTLSLKSATQDAIILDWTASPQADVYDIFVLRPGQASYVDIADVAEGTLTYSYLNPTNGEYKFKVQARNTAGQTMSNVVTTQIGTTGVDPDYQGVLDFATANGIALPSASQQAADDAFIKDQKAKNSYQRASVFFRPASTASIAFKLICWKRKIQMVQYGSLIWTDTGVEGNGANGYIDPLINVSTDANFKAGDASILYYSLKCPAENKAVVGAYTGTTADYILFTPKKSDNGVYAFLNGGTTLTPPGFTVGPGLISLNRRVSDATLTFRVGANATPPFGGTPVIMNGGPFILARKRIDTGGNADIYSTEKFKFMAIGASFDDLHNDLNNSTY